MLVIILQPFKYTKVNTYHTLLLLVIAIGYFSVTLIDEVESKAHLMITKMVLATVWNFLYTTHTGRDSQCCIINIERSHTLWLKSESQN